MKNRKLDPDSCSVYASRNSLNAIPWDQDISTINSDEIIIRLNTDVDPFDALRKEVSVRRFHDIHKSISFSVCDCCKKMIYLNGIVCRACGLRCHPTCFNGAPRLCEVKLTSRHVNIEFARILALNQVRHLFHTNWAKFPTNKFLTQNPIFLTNLKINFVVS